MKEYTENVPTWVWLTSLLLPPVSSVIALTKWVERDLCGGLAAFLAGVFGLQLWAIVILLLAYGAGSA